MQVKDLIVTGDAKIIGNLYTNDDTSYMETNNPTGTGTLTIDSIQVMDGAAENGDQLLLTAEGLSKINTSASINVNGVSFLSGNINMDNVKSINMKNASGASRSMISLNDSNNYAFGYGGYSNSEGASYFDGNAVSIRSRGAVSITSPTAGLTDRQYGVNKVLASGAQYMSASHTWTLSEAVSAQPNGIVLIWSWYDGQAYDTNWNSFFVPKQLVASHGGASFNFFIVRAGLAHACQKTLMISNTSITGVATNNQASSTGSGITNTPNNFVLRYVYGI